MRETEEADCAQINTNRTDKSSKFRLVASDLVKNHNSADVGQLCAVVSGKASKVWQPSTKEVQALQQKINVFSELTMRDSQIS